ncbi:BEL1-like homeodomain protein 4 [Dichanthelium oligosanthes]|uniref:BEL1-like homeodomain protein 4 n=1 Tax=Dichanthelium oligosanthes TaxID=888268 RepID=A0A1E5WM37_9POAL|nr:BEL1-like homeodomain protein 4 [Dichanthelium oligosanthes]
MGIAAPPSQPGQTTTYVSQPNKSSAAISGRPATASSMSHSQGFHEGSSGVFGYSSDGFDRPDSSQDHQQQHVAQQSRRDKLRVQGFDPAAAAGHGLLPIDGDEHAEPGAMYEHAAAAAGASNMLSEMFNFPAPPSGPSATELLASQMNANYRFGLRQGPGGVAGLSGDGGWFGAGAAGRAGLVLGGTNMGSLGETSSPKQQGSMAGLATDPATAMQLFLMNPQQQQSRSSPTSPQPSDVQHHEAFQAFGSAAASFGGGGAGVMEGQGLSLSLSPSLQQLEMAKQAEELRVRDGVLYFNRQPQQQQGPSAVQQLPMALHGGQVGALGQQLHVGYGPAGVAGVLRNSKYTRAAQELLEEFCSVGRGQIKGGARGGRGASASNNPNASKGGGGGASSSGAAQSPSSASKEPPQLSPADRFEHQRKKAKLISMLDEARPPLHHRLSSFLSCMHGMAWLHVDRRYNHYCDQMQMVVNFFDSVMGFGAATPYTALAQKAMSRHFRCLKDAIASQLRHTCELLGEKDAGTSSGLTKGETPRLRAIDQSLRQQRAFHHMGMMEQEAWRPQRGLPERSVNILRSWLFEHFLHPYPSDADKHLLARQTGLSRNQVSNWFINARVRLWKPMIEEMYQQECRELEGSSAGGGGPESGNDPSAADDTHSPTTTGAAQLPQQQHGTAAPGVTMPHKPDPGAVGPSAADAAFVGIDPVELLGGDAHVGGGADDLYGRFEPGVRMRYGPGATAAAAGDVSLTLGLQHAGAGNAGPDGTGRFSLRDYSGC